MDEKKKGKAKKALSIIGNIVMYLFFALCIVAVIFSISAKRSKDGAVNLFGYELRVVMSPSMAKSDMTDVSEFKIKDIPVKSVVVTKTLPESNDPEIDQQKKNEWYSKLKVGDVLTFRYVIASRQETITHRIISIEMVEDGYKITLRGDNRTENEGTQTIYTANYAGSGNYIIGKVVYTSYPLGFIIYNLQRPLGIALTVIIPAAIIIIFQIIKIATVVGGERKKKTAAREAEVAAREAEKNDEIELLKRRLAEIERQQNTAGGSDTSPGEPVGANPPPEADTAVPTQSDAAETELPPEGNVHQITPDDLPHD